MVIISFLVFELETNQSPQLNLLETQIFDRSPYSFEEYWHMLGISSICIDSGLFQAKVYPLMIL